MGPQFTSQECLVQRAVLFGFNSGLVLILVIIPPYRIVHTGNPPFTVPETRTVREQSGYEIVRLCYSGLASRSPESRSTNPNSDNHQAVLFLESKGCPNVTFT
jgi:hypothetical protein